MRWPSSLLILFPFFFCNIGFASVDSLLNIWKNENQTDSIRFKALNEFYLKNTYAAPEKSLRLLNQHLSFAKAQKNFDEVFNALNEKAVAFIVLGKVDSSITMLNSALDVSIQQKDTLKHALVYSNLANIYRYQNKYQEAISNYTKSLMYFEKRPSDLHRRADLLNNIGLVYDDIGMSQMSLSYLTEAFKCYKKIDSAKVIGNIWLNLGEVYNKLDSVKKAKQLLLKGLNQLTLENNQSSIADCHLALGRVYSKMSQKENAIIQFKQGISIYEEIGNRSKTISAKTFFANYLYAFDSISACQIANELKNNYPKGIATHVKKDLFYLLYKCYKSQNNKLQALKMLEQYHFYNDSLIQAKNRLTIVREAIKSEYEEKLYENELENEKKEAQLKILQLKKTFALITSFLVFTFLFFIYFKGRLNRERHQKKLLLQEIEKLKKTQISNNPLGAGSFTLKREIIEANIGKKLNETDWTVLNILVDDPVMSNKDLASKAFLTVDGIGSSLRRMYQMFDIKESRYKKISLLMEAIKISSGQKNP